MPDISHYFNGKLKSKRETSAAEVNERFAQRNANVKAPSCSILVAILQVQRYLQPSAELVHSCRQSHICVKGLQDP